MEGGSGKAGERRKGMEGKGGRGEEGREGEKGGERNGVKGAPVCIFKCFFEQPKRGKGERNRKGGEREEERGEKGREMEGRGPPCVSLNCPQNSLKEGKAREEGREERGREKGEKKGEKWRVENPRVYLSIFLEQPMGIIPTLAAQSVQSHCIVPMCDITPFIPSTYNIA